MTNPPTGNSSGLATPTPPDADAIRDWLLMKISEAQQISTAEVPLDEPLMAMGLDSMRVLVLVGELEQWLGYRFSGNPLVDNPTIDSLSQYLADQLGHGASPAGPN